MANDNPPPPITLVGNVLTHFRYRIELQSSRICLNIRYISFKNKYLSQSPKNVMISRQLEANRNTCIKNNGRFLLIIAWEYCTGKLFIKKQSLWHQDQMFETRFHYQIEVL